MLPYGVGADSISARGILRSRQMPRDIAASRRGEQCSPEGFYAAAHCHGRTMFAPTAHIRSDVGGGVPDAPAITRTLRADIESAPTHRNGHRLMGIVGEHSICSRRILRRHQIPRDVAVSRRGEQCSSERFYPAAHCHGRTLFAPTRG